VLLSRRRCPRQSRSGAGGWWCSQPPPRDEQGVGGLFGAPGTGGDGGQLQPLAAPLQGFCRGRSGVLESNTRPIILAAVPLWDVAFRGCFPWMLKSHRALFGGFPWLTPDPAFPAFETVRGSGLCVHREGFPVGAGGPFRLSGGDCLPLRLEALRLQPPPDQFGEGDPLLCRDSLQLLALPRGNPEVEQRSTRRGLIGRSCRHRL
jgi:hypothetical protein